MNLFSRYCCRVGGTTRTDIVGVEYGVHATPRKTASEKSFKTLSMIQRLDQKLWTFSAGTVVESVVRPERISSAWSRDCMLLLEKQPPESPLKLSAQSNGRIKNLWTFSAGSAIASVV